MFFLDFRRFSFERFVILQKYQWYWNVTWRRWGQHLDPLCTHGHLNFQNYYIMHAPTMTCDIRIEHPPSSQKNPGTCCFHVFTTSVFHKRDSMPPPFTHRCYIFVEAFGWFLSKLPLFLWYSFLMYVYMYLNV